MRILLRHKESGLFWERPDRWIDNPDLAYDFRFIDRALHYVEHFDHEVEVALEWDSPLHVESIPMEQTVTLTAR